MPSPIIPARAAKDNRYLYDSLKTSALKHQRGTLIVIPLIYKEHTKYATLARHRTPGSVSLAWYSLLLISIRYFLGHKSGFFSLNPLQLEVKAGNNKAAAKVEGIGALNFLQIDGIPVDKEIVITDPRLPLGNEIGHLKRNRDLQCDGAIEHDIILLWTDQPHIITSADILAAY